MVADCSSGSNWPDNYFTEVTEAATWNRYATNCFPDHGADVVLLPGCAGGSGDNCYVSPSTLPQCRALCLATSGCEAIVMNADETKCYGRKDVVVADCPSGSNWPDNYFTEVTEAAGQLRGYSANSTSRLSANDAGQGLGNASYMCRGLVNCFPMWGCCIPKSADPSKCAEVGHCLYDGPFNHNCEDGQWSNHDCD